MAKNNSNGQILLEMILFLGVLVILLTTILAKDYKKQKDRYRSQQIYQVKK